METYLSNKNNLTYSSVYCLKALGAFFVVWMHCLETPWEVYPIIRTAVPFFFMTSGFFLYRNDYEAAIDKCISVCKKMFWLAIYANIFYYICFCLPNNVLPIRRVKILIDLIVIGDNLGFHLWYLNAYIEALILIIFALKFNKLSWLWCCIPFFILWDLLTEEYNFLFPYLSDKLEMLRISLVKSIPYLGIGWLLRKYHKKILRTFSSPFVIFAIFLVLSYCEILILHSSDKWHHADYILTTFLLASSILLIAIKYPQFGRGTMMEEIGKDYSLYIYVFHIFVWKTFHILNPYFWRFSPDFYPIIVYGLTIIFTMIWQKSSKIFFP